MKLTEAKAICKYFPAPDGVEPPRDENGKIRCYYLMADGEMCKRPDRYRCDVVTVKRSRDAAPAQKPLSTTRIGNWLACQRRWAIEYVYKARPAIEADWKIVGRIFASCRARIDAGEPFGFETDGLSEVAAAKLVVVLEEYQRRSPAFGFPPLVSEQYVQFDFEGVRFGGYLDAVSRDGTLLVEWKHAAMDYDLLKVARQLAVYVHSLPQVKELVIAVASKPQQRQKKGESIEVFTNRLREVCAADEGLFTFTRFARDKLDTAMLLRQMVEAHNQSQAALRVGEFVPNLGSMQCGLCEWAQLCADHLNRPLGCPEGGCNHQLVCAKVRTHHTLAAATKAPQLAPETEE